MEVVFVALQVQNFHPETSAYLPNFLYQQIDYPALKHFPSVLHHLNQMY